MMAGTEPVWADFSAEVAPLRLAVGVGKEGAAVGTVLWDSELLYETGVPPEIVREYEGVNLNVAEGDGEGEKLLKFTIGGEPGSAISW
jgi:hypothetical protein